MEDDCKSSLNFFSDQQLCYADILAPPEAIARIQVAVLNFLRILTSPAPAISDLPLVITYLNSSFQFSAASIRIFSPAKQKITQKLKIHRSPENQATAASIKACSLRLRGFSWRTLSAPGLSHGRTPPELLLEVNILIDLQINYIYLCIFKLFCVWICNVEFTVTVWKLMAMCSRILGLDKKVTQRELFYKLLCDSPDYFSSQSQVNRTIQGEPLHQYRLQFCFSLSVLSSNTWNAENWTYTSADVVALLRCSRYSLGIMASSRGLVAGRLQLQVNPHCNL